MEKVKIVRNPYYNPPIIRQEFSEVELLADLLAHFLRVDHPDAWEQFLKIPRDHRRDVLNAMTAHLIDTMLEYIKIQSASYQIT